MDRGCRNRSSFDEMVALVVLLRQQSLCFSYLHAIERQQGRWETINDALDLASARMGARPVDRRRHRQSIGENLRKRRSSRIRLRQEDIISRRRHIVTDTQGHLIGVVIHAADPRRRAARPVFDPLGLSLVAPSLCRRRLCRPQTRAGPRRTGRLDRRNRQTAQRNQQLRAHRAPMGGRVVERTLAWLGAVAASPKTSKPRSRALSHGSLSPISGA
jgi:hypothetical protein